MLQRTEWEYLLTRAMPKVMNAKLAGVMLDIMQTAVDTR